MSHDSFESAKAFYTEMKARVKSHGREPDSLKILPAATPLVGETQAIADEKSRTLRDLVDPHAGLSTLSYHLDVDLGRYPLDAPLPDIDVPGVQGHYQEVREATERGQRAAPRTRRAGPARQTAPGKPRRRRRGTGRRCHSPPPGPPTPAVSIASGSVPRPRSARPRGTRLSP